MLLAAELLPTPRMRLSANVNHTGNSFSPAPCFRLFFLVNSEGYSINHQHDMAQQKGTVLSDPLL